MVKRHARQFAIVQAGGNAANASGCTLRTRAAMSSIDRQTAKEMADPFSLGGFIPEFDRNGFKAINIQHDTGLVTPAYRAEDLDDNMINISEDTKLGV